ncbi:tRNA glutamyl-Q(34) synthetase GluQRS [Tabrizicola sp. J26]|uniref:tRNA glutamyl-Q(34) synthetase GluQRS n=1 Tax=Alitabrizicola rongguiensis TaxID=2909234 RepID=UPI001F47E0EB|nr:tRNA glutamyl-Q(34) synthetase GluQRS [Tabrizicola rongguiensis]MCF1709992.1 tRNA glutamyl-Q(34) synthetase GluQRS [Tabrizicola rongguiensis]
MAGYLTRFAPSPTGPLHLGHAYSALTAFGRAQAQGGTFLLRIEDIDRSRCRPEWEAQIYDDLHWLGLSWPEPVMRQSDRLPAYAAALDRLAALGLLYPCRCTRADIRAALSAPQEGAMGPDGPVYPGTCRHRPMTEAGPQDAIRLDMAKAMALSGSISFCEYGPLRAGLHSISLRQMVETIGDVVLARRDMGTSYHLSVTVDDAAQGVTEVVRGIDLFEATAIHVLLQRLLNNSTPTYWHHDLIRDDQGKRLAKRDDARAIVLYRKEGATPAGIRAMVGL